MSLVALVAIGVLISFLWFKGDTATGNQPNANVTNTRATPAATPTATIVQGGWGPWDYNASINEGERLTFYRGTTPERCQEDCDATPRCRAFTYIRAGAYNPNDPPMCYLMSEAKKLSPSPCCISAIKQ